VVVVVQGNARAEVRCGDRDKSSFSGRNREHVSSIERATLTTSTLDRSWRKEVTEVDTSGGDYIFDRAAGKAVREDSAIVELTDRERRPLVFVGRTACQPSSMPSLPHALQAINERRGAHHAAT
jgi:hypothetical protein